MLAIDARRITSYRTLDLAQALSFADHADASKNWFTSGFPLSISLPAAEGGEVVIAILKDVKKILLTNGSHG